MQNGALNLFSDGILGTYTTRLIWAEYPNGMHCGIDATCLDANRNIVATTGWEVSGLAPMIDLCLSGGRVLNTLPAPAIRPTHRCCRDPHLPPLLVPANRGHLCKARAERVGRGRVS